MYQSLSKIPVKSELQHQNLTDRMMWGEKIHLCASLGIFLAVGINWFQESKLEVYCILCTFQLHSVFWGVHFYALLIKKTSYEVLIISQEILKVDKMIVYLLRIIFKHHTALYCIFPYYPSIFPSQTSKWHCCLHPSLLLVSL